MALEDDFFNEVLLFLFDTVALKADIASLTLIDTIRAMKETGMSDEFIRKTLISDLNEGGRVFGTLRSAFISSSQQSLERVSGLVTNTIFKSELSGEQLYTWVLTKANNCDDCIARSKEEPKTITEWELQGKPQSGVTTCGLNCGCFLDPVGANPIKDFEREVVSANE